MTGPLCRQGTRHREGDRIADEAIGESFRAERKSIWDQGREPQWLQRPSADQRRTKSPGQAHSTASASEVADDPLVVHVTVDVNLKLFWTFARRSTFIT